MYCAWTHVSAMYSMCPRGSSLSLSEILSVRGCLPRHSRLRGSLTPSTARVRLRSLAAPRLSQVSDVVVDSVGRSRLRTRTALRESPEVSLYKTAKPFPACTGNLIKFSIPATHLRKNSQSPTVRPLRTRIQLFTKRPMRPSSPSRRASADSTRPCFEPPCL